MNSHVFSARHAALWAAKQLFFSPLIRDLNLEQQILGAFCRELLPVSHNRANALTCFFACSGFRRFKNECGKRLAEYHDSWRQFFVFNQIVD